ncbi:type IX secretion system membrane protein PorP/SprF [Fulvivirga maritima]|uniref:PorP/SprF family type IX secretion system membrane protein n=1 Tax=Fulvivirga maritima TaxID=2904247 RepID=UPI001F3D634D|nr:type IX secretion system membrane protein PorP/SprF [Fulvivirga maritima]UII26252.1 type IX secretion system membrane protein PorP/SprF [Fulvivirga maritima]
MYKNITYIFIIVGSLFLVRMEAKAQQDPVYSQYMFNMLTINPAYAGNREVLSVTSIYRSQWRNIEGGMNTQLFTADVGLKNKKVGLGLQVFNDNVEIIRNTGFYAMYSYKIRLNKGVLNFGIQAGAVKFKANYNQLQLYDYNDPAFMDNQNEFRVNFGAGLFYNTDRFYVGFSVPHLTGQGRVEVAESSQNIYEQSNHWFLTGGYVFDISPDIDLKPSFLLRAVNGAPLHYDIGTTVWLMNLAAVGVSYRSSEVVVGMLELQLIPQLRIGYAYDLTLSELGRHSTHEIMLRYEFGYSKKDLVSPRFF